MNLYIAPISSTPAKKGNSGRNKTKQDGNQKSFADYLQNAAVDENARQRRDGFAEKSPRPAVLQQSDVAGLAQLLQQANGRILSIMRPR